MPKHPAMQYADDVIAGKVVTCRMTRLAVERHLRDLETGKDRGLYFDEAAGQHFLDIFPATRHIEGPLRGQPIVPEPWQQFQFYTLYGWMRDNGTRRFREDYNQMGRKNGKTVEGAVVGIYGTFYDGEGGAKGFVVATKYDQACICHYVARDMVRQSPEFSEDIKTLTHSLYNLETGCRFLPLGRDHHTLDGLNPNLVVIDELHAHKDPGVLRVMGSAVGARPQPLLFEITTPGDDTTSVCFDQYTYAKQVLTGVIEDDDFYACIYELDDDDDWRDEALWIKPNPNLGVSVYLDDLRRMARKAKNNPRKLNNFLVKRMGRWVRQVVRWLDMDAWDACAAVTPTDYPAVRKYITEMETDLEGAACLAGLDLGYKRDLSAFVLLFPPAEQDGLYRVLCKFWMPEDSPSRTEGRFRDQYDFWLREGWIKGTPGDVVDYQTIEDDIVELWARWHPGIMAYDRTFGAQLCQRLDTKHGLNVVDMQQGMITMSPPAKELETAILAGKVDHGAHPTLRWMADNAAVKEDTGGNIRPVKPPRESGLKVDGIQALVMGWGQHIRHREEDPDPKEVYNRRGMREL